jgi:hypothetical protein
LITRGDLVIKASVAYVLCRIEDDSSLTPISEHEDLSSGIKAGRHMVEVEDHDFSYGLYTSAWRLVLLGSPTVVWAIESGLVGADTSTA